MKEKRNTIIFSSILGAIAICLLYANLTGWALYNSDKVVQENEKNSSRTGTRMGRIFHHK